LGWPENASIKFHEVTVEFKLISLLDIHFEFILVVTLLCLLEQPILFRGYVVFNLSGLF